MTEDRQNVPEEQVTANGAEQSAQENPDACADPAEFDKILQMIEEKNRQLDETTNRLQRLQADFDNFRRRTRQEKTEIGAVATENVVIQLLPVIDNFERALAASGDQERPEWFNGIEMIYRQLVTALENIGVVPIKAVGNPFDPKLHEAVMRVEDDTYSEVTVIEELQKGYQLHGKTIRPSMVKVAGS